MVKNQSQKLISNVMYCLVLLLPFWWITGLKLFIFQLAILITYFIVFFKRKEGLKIRFSKLNILLLLFIIVYTYSLTVNMFYEDISRIIGSFYNLTFWIMGFFILLLMSKVEFEISTWKKLFNAFRINGIIISLLSIGALLYWKFVGIRLEIRTLLDFLIPQSLSTSVISDTIKPLILRPDWFLNEPMPRLSVFFLYPTALGIGIAVCMFMTIAYHFINNSKKMNLFIDISLMLIPLIFSFSRIVFIGMLVSIILVKIISAKSSKKRFYKYFFSVTTILACLVPIILMKFDDFFGFILNSREGSTDLRMSVYNLAINYAIENNPIFGVGVKPVVEDLRISIGSHSTLVGTFLKTGFIGIVLLILINLMVLVSLIKLRKYMVDKKHLIVWECLTSAFITIVLWMFTEDIDAPQNVAFFYFLIIGLIIGLHNKAKKVANTDIF